MVTLQPSKLLLAVRARYPSPRLLFHLTLRAEDYPTYGEDVRLILKRGIKNTYYIRRSQK